MLSALWLISKLFALWCVILLALVAVHVRLRHWREKRRERDVLARWAELQHPPSPWMPAGNDDYLIDTRFGRRA